MIELRVDIDGLDELVDKLQRAAADGVFTRAHAEVGRLVDAGAKGRARGRQMARAVRSNQLKVAARGPQIKVGGGGGDRRWAVGAQFGSVAYRQFPARVAEGYTVWPAIDDNLPRIEQAYVDAVLDQF